MMSKQEDPNGEQCTHQDVRSIYHIFGLIATTPTTTTTTTVSNEIISFALSLPIQLKIYTISSRRSSFCVILNINRSYRHLSEVETNDKGHFQRSNERRNIALYCNLLEIKFDKLHKTNTLNREREKKMHGKSPTKQK